MLFLFRADPRLYWANNAWENRVYIIPLTRIKVHRYKRNFGNFILQICNVIVGGSVLFHKCRTAHKYDKKYTHMHTKQYMKLNDWRRPAQYKYWLHDSLTSHRFHEEYTKSTFVRPSALYKVLWPVTVLEHLSLILRFRKPTRVMPSPIFFHYNKMPVHFIWVKNFPETFVSYP